MFKSVSELNFADFPSPASEVSLGLTLSCWHHDTPVGHDACMSLEMKRSPDIFELIYEHLPHLSSEI